MAKVQAKMQGKTEGPEDGLRGYDQLVSLCRQQYSKVETGQFGANMKVQLINDGPVTFWLET